jgi:hypothetical protein
MTQAVTKRLANLAIALCSFAGLSFAASPTFAQSYGWSASATVQVYAEVIEPLQVQSVAPLSFGGLRGGIDAGVVTISPDGDRTMSGGAMSIEDLMAQDGPQASDGPPPSAAVYNVMGEAGRSYRVSTPQSVSVVGRPVDANDVAMTLVADNFVVQTQSQPTSGNFGQLDAYGRDSFRLGASINVPAQAAAAYYVIQVPVMVEYA